MPMSVSRRFAALLLAVLAGAASAAHAADRLSVCIDRSSPSARMDRRLAQAVAEQQHRVLAVREFDGRGDDDGFDLAQFNRMAGEACELVLGFPVDAQGGAVPEGLRATEAYGRTGFVLATRDGLGDSLKALPRGTAVGVTYQTTPNLYLGDYPGLQAQVYPTEAATLAALVAGKVRAATLWQPTLADYLASHAAARPPLRYRELAEPHARWGLVALYLKRNQAAAARFQAGVAMLRRSGALTPLLAPYAAPADPAQATPLPRTAWVRPRRLPGLACASAPALYTEAQAASGKQKFEDNCAQCHGSDLQGRAGPALKGKHFASPQAGFHVGDIFTIVSQNMPATQPGSLANDDYVEIMAYILQQNGYPAGSRALGFDEARQSKVPLTYQAQ